MGKCSSCIHRRWTCSWWLRRRYNYLKLWTPFRSNLLTQLIAAIIIIGFGTGGIKSNIAPLIADQYQRRKMAIKTQKSGERTIIDPAITYQRIYMVFYWCINLGSLSLIATPFMEKAKGYETEPCKSIEPLKQYADLSPLL